jgi:DNA processing protein
MEKALNNPSIPNDWLYKIALTQIPLVGPVTAKNLISYCGGVEAVFKETKRGLLKIPSVGEAIADHLLMGQQQAFSVAEKELAFIEKNNVTPIFYLDKTYPQRLRHYVDSPIVLYFQGSADLNHFRTLGVIGTRKPTEHGKKICREFVEQLKPYNPYIISGLAYGIDITAHQASVEYGLPTIGVLGSGLGNIYPSTHYAIAQKMLEQGGLLSQFLHYTKPDRENFPMRNRILAALSDSVLVVETAEEGGSMITANIAEEYNKDVFAVPGRVSDKYSKGCNLLIKSNKAALVETPNDLLDRTLWERLDAPKRTVQAQLFLDNSDDELLILQILKQADEMSIDRISNESKFLPSELAAVLLNLEFQGQIKALPGKRYMLY